MALAEVRVSAQLLFHCLYLYLPEGSGQGEGFSTVHSEPVNFHCRDEGGGGWGILSHVLFDNKKQQCLRWRGGGVCFRDTHWENTS